MSMTSKLTLAVIGKNDADIYAFNRENMGDATLILVVNDGNKPLSSIGNRYLKECSTPVFGFAHADTGFGPGALESFVACSLDGNVCGIVGRTMDLNYHWCSGTTDTDGPAEVSTLDSSSVFFLPKSGLCFDTKTFDGFHCHVEDLCLQARQQGMRVVVPKANASHAGGSNGDKWNSDYFRYVEILRRKWANKWPGLEFITV